MAYLSQRSGTDDQDIQSQGLQRQGSNVSQASGQTQTGTPSAPKAPNEFTKSGFNTASKILDRNKGASTQAVGNRAFSGAESAANDAVNAYSGAGQNLKNETNKSVNSLAAPTTEAVRSGIQSGGSDYDQFSQMLSAGRKVEAPKAAEIQKPNFDVGQYAENRSFSPLLQKTAEGPYSRGMGALDASFLSRAGLGQQFQQRAQDLSGRVSGAEQGYQKQIADSGAQVQTAATNQSDMLRKILGDMKGEFDQTRESNFQNLTGQDQTALTAQRDEALGGFQGQLQSTYDDRMNQLNQGRESGNIDENEYYIAANQVKSAQADALAKAQGYVQNLQPQGGARDYRGAYSPEQADQLNRIFSLLGEAPSAVSSQGQAPKIQADPNQFQNFLKGLSGAGQDAVDFGNFRRNLKVGGKNGAQVIANLDRGNVNAATRASTGGNAGTTGSMKKPETSTPTAKNVGKKSKETAASAVKNSPIGKAAKSVSNTVTKPIKKGGKAIAKVGKKLGF